MADSTTTPVSHGDRVCLNLPNQYPWKIKIKIQQG